jgi:hypothetical protein
MKVSHELLRYMAKNKVAIEINLVSNEFILKVKENRHPICCTEMDSTEKRTGQILRINMTI